jgi:multimeric flavodoxin WrbA
MKAILFDGSQGNDSAGERVREALTAQLRAQGWDVKHIVLREKKIGPCAGDFFCFIRTPGVCNINDDNRAIAEALVNSDLVVYLTPVTFGGYSPTLKCMVDHQIQNISPFFARVGGETHHARRYRKNPDFLVVGWMEAPDAQVEAIFRHLVQRNALNWHAGTWVGDVIPAYQSEEELLASARRWVDGIQNRNPSPQVELPASRVTTGYGPMEMRRALLLVGSPKTRKSTSNSLGTYLFEQLGVRGVETETIYLHTILRSPKKMQALMDAVDAADLVMLAFPIYVDSLPAPVIETLERIATHRKEHHQTRRQLFAAIANCGFPEAYQCNTALAICERFANRAGFEWAGGIALGGGGMVNGYPLADGGGKTIRMRQALDLAAEGLAQGQAISVTAREGLAKPIIPHWLYWLVSFQRWVLDSRQYGALRGLWRRPYLHRAS